MPLGFMCPEQPRWTKQQRKHRQPPLDIKCKHSPPIGWERSQNCTHQMPLHVAHKIAQRSPPGNKQVLVNIQRNVNLSIPTPPSSARRTGKQLSRQRTGKNRLTFCEV